MLLLAPLNVYSYPVLNKKVLVMLIGQSLLVSCILGCDDGASDSTLSPYGAGPNLPAAFDFASTGGLQSQGLLPGWGGENFLV